MQKLRVTWNDKGWDPGETESVATADIPADSTPVNLGNMLVFRNGPRSTVVLVVPQHRLIAAVQVEVEG